ncbi:MAG: alanine racemase [Candidatus Kuenenbacteria bacterium]
MIHRFLTQQWRAWKQSQNIHKPIINIEISKSALLINFRALQSLAPQWQIAPVLKSNAYGHGLILIANILQNEKDLPFFCVDSYFEAESIRNTGIKTPILIIGYTPTMTIQKK